MKEKKVISFGEIMVRLNPKGYLRISQADEFEVSYTGAEANVCVSLAVQGLKTEFVTKIPDNIVTACVSSRLRSFDVGVSKIVYGGDRIGVYYLEKGASQRASKLLYDRKYSSLALADRSDFDWESIMIEGGWFHFTGITPALGGNLPEICEDACRAAKQNGMIISCDLNYRGTLWSKERAQQVMSQLAPYCDVIIGNEEDAEACLGIKPANTDVVHGKLNKSDYEQIAQQISKKYGCRYVAFTLRESISASDNNWSGILYTEGKTFFSRQYSIHMVDRVGGGDSFAGGLIYALFTGMDEQDSIEYAVAASCLKQTMEKDFNLATRDEILKLMNGDGSGRVQR